MHMRARMQQLISMAAAVISEAKRAYAAGKNINKIKLTIFFVHL